MEWYVLVPLSRGEIRIIAALHLFFSFSPKYCMQSTVAFSSPRSNRAESDRTLYIGRILLESKLCSGALRLMLDIDLMYIQ